MQNKDQLINKFSGLIPFVQSLQLLDDKIWNSPIEEGKWTTGDVIAHIMLWDKYFLEEAIQKITNHQPLTSKHLDFDEFNKKAIDYAKENSKQEVIDRTVYYRNEVINEINSIPVEDFTKEYLDGDGNIFSVYDYLLGFISHDLHHINQLKDFFSKIADR
ncbi:DinB family protein [Aquibacillus rhizosphaerae]|uniref:DinB family protein n=1 Tax=Aquibacillus rhizosphaerae TaxID=3051431 RepID=A0ABT7L8Z8_9BACI|nr:DinB family protein [Aquibacillus sp. LR5S19]MDL4842351.1 DinB family protein [Aquibacillus sp. LR5S19]